MAVFNLCTVNQGQEIYIFEDLVTSFAYGLNILGHTVYVSINSLKTDAINIVFGSHVSPESIAPQLPPDSIIFNTEQVGSVWMTPHYISLLKHFKVWDYSQYNISLLKEVHGIKNVTYNPVGYCPILEKIEQLPEDKKDIDVLFYGGVNERRRKIMKDLHDRGLTTMFAYDAFGATRNKLIARSKIVINIHFWDTAILETVRLSYLLNNKAFVVTEKSSDWKLCEAYHFTMVMSDYKWLVEDCMEYIKAPDRRKNVAECGYQLFKEYKQENLITL